MCHYVVVYVYVCMLSWWFGCACRLICDCDKLEDNVPSLLSSGNCNGLSDYIPDAPTHILQCYHDYTTNPSPDHNEDLVVKCCELSVAITSLTRSRFMRLVCEGLPKRALSFITSQLTEDEICQVLLERYLYFSWSLFKDKSHTHTYIHTHTHSVRCSC